MSIKSAIGSFIRSCETLVTPAYNNTNAKCNEFCSNGAKFVNSNLLVQTFDKAVTDPLASLASQSLVSLLSKTRFSEPSILKHRIFTVSSNVNTAYIIGSVALGAIGVATLNPVTLGIALVAGRVIGKTLHHPTTDGISTTLKKAWCFIKNPSKSAFIATTDSSAEAAKLKATTCGQRYFGIFKVIA